MIYIQNTTSKQVVQIAADTPVAIATLKLVGTVNLTEIYNGVVENIGTSQTYFVCAIELPEDVESGEYEYTLTQLEVASFTTGGGDDENQNDENQNLETYANGLAVVGDYQALVGEYQKNITYKQYEQHFER